MAYIQETLAPQGAQKPLSTDSPKSTKGGDFSQDNLSFCRGDEVAASSHQIPVGSGLADFGCSGVAVSVELTSANHLEGSHKGDHRAKAAPAVLPANPAPREPKGQTTTENGKHC